MVQTGKLAPAAREEQVALVIGEHVHHDGTVGTVRNYQREAIAGALDSRFLCKPVRVL